MAEIDTRPQPNNRFWFYLSMLLLAAVGLSLLLNLILSLAVAGSQSDDSNGFSAQLVDGDAKEEALIAIVPIQGMIMEPPSSSPGKGSYSGLVKLLKKLEKEPHLKGVLLVIDSPGGGVTTSDRMYEALKRFKANKKVPMVALFEDVAASGGYYVAMAADHIIAHPTSITGSIGVISQFYEVSELMERFGVDVNVVKSLNDQGKESFKDMGSPYRKMKPQERALFQALVTEMWERFTAIVAEGRKGKLTLAQVRQLADGRVFTGEEALKHKLVDQVGYDPEAYAEIRKRAGSPAARIVRYSPTKGWQDLFTAHGEAMRPRLELDRPSARPQYLWEPR